jgi:sugar-specific transcriptional regulator TrmB
MDTKIFEEIGLTQGEIKTYLALLKLGSSSTGPIAKKSQVSRSKLYHILDKLEMKGFVSHIQKSGVTYFQAVEPSKVKDYLREKEENLHELQKRFDKFLPKLELYQQEAENTSSVNVYSGFRGIHVAHEHTYLKLKRGEEYLYLGVPAYQPPGAHLYWKRDHVRRAKAGIKCRLLFNSETDTKTIQNRNSYKGADARLMPIDIVTPAGFLIYKDTTTIILQFPTELAIEIVNKDVADSFRVYFEAFWKKTILFNP